MKLVAALALLFLLAVNIFFQLWSFRFVWPERSSGKDSTERRRGADLLLKGLWVVLSITLLGFYIVMANIVINWVAAQLRGFSTLLVLLFVSLAFLWSVIYIVEELMVLSFWGRSKEDHKFLRLGFFIGIAKELFPFPMYFISFAHLSRELSSQGYAVFQNASAEIGPWIRYAIKTGIDAVDSDVISILNIELSTIEPVSVLARGADLSFRLFVKLILLAVILKIFYLFIKRGESATEPPDSSVDDELSGEGDPTVRSSPET